MQMRLVCKKGLCVHMLLEGLEMKRIFRAFFFRLWLSRWKWYRRWYGGRWEYHWIDVCHSAMWLDMRPDRCWPEWVQPCSRGTPIIEDYPTPNAEFSGTPVATQT